MIRHTTTTLAVLTTIAMTAAGNGAYAQCVNGPAVIAHFKKILR